MPGSEYPAPPGLTFYISISISKSLIDNIFLNTIDYNSFSGNITIQLSDHLFQFIILEGFFKDLIPRKIKIKERNFNFFNENEFSKSIKNMNWEEILLLNNNDPNFPLVTELISFLMKWLLIKLFLEKSIN